MKAGIKSSLISLLALALALPAAAATIKISEEPIATNWSGGADLLINVVSGTNYATRRIALSNLLDALPSRVVISNATTNLNTLVLRTNGGGTGVVVNAAGDTTFSGAVGIKTAPQPAAYDLKIASALYAQTLNSYYGNLDANGLSLEAGYPVRAKDGNLLLRTNIFATKGLSFFGQWQPDRGTNAPWNQSYTNIILGTNVTAGGLGGWICLPDRAGLKWADGSYLFGWNDHQFDGQHGAELQIGSGNSLCLYGGPNGKIQIGNASEANEVIDISPDSTVSATNQLGHSKALNFNCDYYTGDHVDLARPGIVGWAAGTNTDLGTLAFYNRIPKWTWTYFSNPRGPGELVGLMLTNGWNLRGKLIQERKTETVTNATYTIDFNSAACLDLTLTTNVTFSVANLDVSATNFETRTLILNPNAENRTISLPTSWTWGGVLAVDPSPTNINATNVLIISLKVAGESVYSDARIYSATDGDALLFFARAGITNSTERQAVNSLVRSLKAAGLWTKFDILYPFVGSTSNSCSHNLIDSTHQIAWHLPEYFTWDASGVTGATNDGCYAELTYVPATNQPTYKFTTNSAHIFFYVGQSNLTSKATAHFAGGSLSTNYNFCDYSVSSGSLTRMGGLNSPDVAYIWAGDIRGGCLASRTSATNATYYAAGQSVSSTAPSTIIPQNYMRLFGGSGAGDSSIDANLRGASFGAGLTPAEWLVYSNIWETFQAALGRAAQRGTDTAWDTNATEFIARAGLTNLTEKLAVNNLVKNLKATNLWTTLDILYPFVGGNSNACAENLISSNHVIQWSRPDLFTFNSDGVTGATNADAYAVLSYNPGTNSYKYTQNNAHLFIYIGNSNITEKPLAMFLGGENGSARTWIDYGNPSWLSRLAGPNSSEIDFIWSYGDIRGPAIVTRTSVTNATYWLGKQVLHNTTANSPGTPDSEIHLFNMANYADTSIDANLRGASFGSGLNPVQWVAYSNIWQTFNTSLGRKAP